jgi:hypothetical protein
LAGRKTANKEQPIEVRAEKTWRDVLKAVTAEHGCLVPQGEVTVSVVLSWTREELLGVLKRSGRIISWKWDKGWENGNERRYAVKLDTAQI